MKMMKKVMVIIDESNSSYDLLIWVLENLKDSIESSKLLIYAKQPPNCFPSHLISPSVGFAQIFYPFSPNAELTKLTHQKNSKIASGLLEKSRKICENHGMKAETFTEVGDPKDSIRKIIKDRDIDLLVMSDQQSQVIKKSLQNTDCSLLVVKKGLRRD